MKPHLRYLRYVLLHKWYVFRAGLMLADPSLSWLWRLLVHDLSKFRPSEWRAYVDNFYRPGEFPKDLTARFNGAWMRHIHRNPHHWQYWILHEDSGRTLVQLMPAHVADEMLADWIGAGTKILKRPTMAECIAETVVWYAANHHRMMLRGITRQHVEIRLLSLMQTYVPLDQQVSMPSPIEQITFVPPDLAHDFGQPGAFRIGGNSYGQQQ